MGRLEVEARICNLYSLDSPQVRGHVTLTSALGLLLLSIVTLSTESSYTRSSSIHQLLLIALP